MIARTFNSANCKSKGCRNGSCISYLIFITNDILSHMPMLKSDVPREMSLPEVLI